MLTRRRTFALPVVLYIILQLALAITWFGCHPSGSLTTHAIEPVPAAQVPTPNVNLTPKLRPDAVDRGRLPAHPSGIRRLW